MTNHGWPIEVKGSLQSGSSIGSSTLEEHDYMGISDVSSQSSHSSDRYAAVTPSQKSAPPPNAIIMENLGDTDLRLGLGPPETLTLLKDLPPPPPPPSLPLTENVKKRGVESSSSSSSSCISVVEPESSSSSVCAENNSVVKSGVKRGYSETIPQVSHAGPAFPWAAGVSKGRQATLAENSCQAAQGRHDSPQKARVVGWPPIGPFRKNTLPPTKAKSEAPTRVDSSLHVYVKVNMDGVPVGRKVDMKAYNSYQALSHALKDMFQLPTSGGTLESGVEKPILFAPGLSLTYEDKDGDWMLVGDVPWSMFATTVRRLRIMKESESATIG